jgi:hypothetical protein
MGVQAFNAEQENSDLSLKTEQLRNEIVKL